MRVCLDAFTVCPVDRHVLEHAWGLVGHDFEDNVQIACATLIGLDAIITRNVADFVDSDIPALTPTDWLTNHMSPSPATS